MLKRKISKVGMSALACAMMLGGVMAGSVSAHAAAVSGGALNMGTTPVIYDNRQAIDVDSNGAYGIIIPTAITFTDDKKTADASVEIVGINGFSLDNFSQLDVETSVASENAYTMVGPGTGATYTLTMEGNQTAFAANKEEQNFVNHLGVGTAADGTSTVVTKENGKAQYTGAATQKGQYLDKLTYKFTEKAKQLV